jgi:4-hydroxyphenylpyruvate dioxygenase
VSFQDTPDTYYDLVDKRLPRHGENIAELRRLQAS